MVRAYKIQQDQDEHFPFLYPGLAYYMEPWHITEYDEGMISQGMPLYRKILVTIVFRHAPFVKFVASVDF